MLDDSAVDRSVLESDPRWKLVSDSDRQSIVALLEQGLPVSAIKRYREVTGRGLKESKAAVEAVMTYARRNLGPPCPKCGQPMRTAKAQQCLHCGADWHERASNTA